MAVGLTVSEVDMVKGQRAQVTRKYSVRNVLHCILCCFLASGNVVWVV